MNVLGLVEYDSDSDHSTEEQNVQQANNTTTESVVQIEIIDVATHTLSIEPTGKDEVEIEFLNTDAEQSKHNRTFTVSNSSFTDAEKSKYKYLQKLPCLDPNVLPDKNTSDSVNYYLEAMKMHDFNLTESIRTNKDFGNPYILLNVVEHFKIDERGSNYPKELFDPHSYPESDFHDQIFRSNTAPPAQQTQPACIVTSAVATTAAALSSMQQHMNRTASYAQQLGEVAQQNRQQYNTSNANAKQISDDDYSSAIHAQIAASISDSVVTGSKDGIFTDRFDRKRKSKWDNPQ